MDFSGKRFITKLKNQYRYTLIISILLLDVFDSTGFCQAVPDEYKDYFVQYNADDETHWDRVLKLIGYKNEVVGRSYAVVAGIDYYPKMSASSKNLRPAGKDIEQLVEYLKVDQNFDEVIVLKNEDVTPENLRYFLYEYLPLQMEGKSKSRFFFAYSGHGMSKGRRGYLLTTEANSLSDRSHSINLSNLKGHIDEIVSVSHYNLVMINSCYSGAFIYRKTFGDQLVPKGKGAHAITAGASNQLTQAISKHGEGSVFFEKFLHGARGKADYDKKGVITVSELYDYIYREVSLATNEQQTPQLGDFSLAGSEGQFFFLNAGLIDGAREDRKNSIEKLKTKYFGEPESVINGFIPKDELDDWVRRNGTSTLLQHAEEGNMIAQRRLGRIYYFRYQDYVSAVNWFKKAANQGDVVSQNNLGVMYNSGLGAEKDYKIAMNWYRKAADQGYASAQSSLGFMYNNGLGVEQDHRIATNWYKKAADQGDVIAQNNLGVMYQNGQGVDQDYKVAVNWYRKAADQGDDTAQSNLGWMYYNGLGIERDYRMAVKWYRKAADQGNVKSQTSLGIMYYNGQGVDQDYKIAASWYRKAAEQGDAKAQYYMGLKYEKGQGVEKSIETAKLWWKKSCDQNYSAACSKLK